MVIERLDVADVIQHPTRYDGQQRLRAVELLRRLLQVPMSPSEAAEELGTTKQTVHAWLKGGYLAEAPDSTDQRRLLDRGDVYAAADLLRQARTAGQVQEGNGSLIAVLRAAYASEPETIDHIFRSPDHSLSKARSLGAAATSADAAATGTKRRGPRRSVPDRRAAKTARKA